MINEQLIEYIKSLQKKGINDEKIKEHLLKYNYSKDLINEIFNEINNEKNSIINKDNKKSIFKKNIINKIIIILIIIITIISGILLIKDLIIKNNNSALNILSKENKECNDVSIKFYELTNTSNKEKNEFICVFSDNSNVQLILENNGEKKIKKIDVYFNNNKIETLNINLMPEKIIPKIIENKNKEEIKEIKIIPYIENEIKCRELIKKNINTC